MLQTVVFVVLVFAAPWVLGPLLPQQPNSIWEVIASVAPAVWSPTFVALGLIALADGTAGLRNQVRERLSYPRHAAAWLGVAVAAPALVTTTGVVAARLAGDGQAFIPAEGIWNAVLIQVTTGAVGEEFGWRGLVLTRLSPRLRPRGAALVMALLWGAWHAPAFFTPEVPHYSWPMIPALLSIVAFGIFLAFLFERTGSSILGTITAHLSLNISLAMGGVELTSRVFWWVTASIYAAGAVWMLLQIGTSLKMPRAVEVASP